MLDVDLILGSPVSSICLESRSCNSLTRVSNDRRPGRLVDLESVVEFNILVGRLLNHSQQDGPTGFGTGNGTMKEILKT